METSQSIVPDETVAVHPEGGETKRSWRIEVLDRPVELVREFRKSSGELWCRALSSMRDKASATGLRVPWIWWMSEVNCEMKSR